MRISNIIIHCSDSLWGTAREIREWHLAREWKDIGYHFVILNGNILPETDFPPLNGSIEVGRKTDGDGILTAEEKGAHALGYNGNSIGICLIGRAYFTPQQIYSLIELCSHLCHRWSISPDQVLGHCETPLSRGKTCPNFNVGEIREKIKILGVK